MGREIELANGRRLHIGHIVDCFGAGGIATGVLGLIRATDGVFVHTVVALVDDVRLLDHVPAGASACVLKPGPTRLAGFVTRLAWLACRRGFDILHCNNHFAWLDAGVASRITGRPCIQTFHGVERPVAEAAVLSRLKCRVAARLTAGVTAVSSASRAMVCDLSGLPASSVEVIPNGVDLARFRPSSSEKAARAGLREELGVGPYAPLVAHVGGLRPVKDQATLLRAWKIALGCGIREASAVLLLCGEGPCGPALRQLAAELAIGDTVRFLGQRPDLNLILPACDIFALSSISEGLSYAVLEAMACGLPVVATRVGGNPELVEDGASGMLVPARDPAALGHALAWLLARPDARRVMARRGREIVERHHDLAVAAGRYVELYQRIADRSHGRVAAHGVSGDPVSTRVDCASSA